MDVGSLNLGALLAIGAFLLALAALAPFIRGQARKATVELLRTELQVEREAREAQERRCTAQIAELRGQVKVVTDAFAEVIAERVAKEVVHFLAERGTTGE